MRRALRSDFVALCVALLLTSPLIYWGLDRREPVVVHEFSLVPSEVRAGDKILRRITVTRLRSCATDIDAVLIDGDRIRWVFDEPEVTRPGPLHVRDTYFAPMIVPVLAAPGAAEIRVVAKRACNPVQKLWPIVTAYEPLNFTILPPDRSTP